MCVLWLSVCTDIWRRPVGRCIRWSLSTPHREIVAPYVPMRPVTRRWKTHTHLSRTLSTFFMSYVLLMYHNNVRFLLSRRLTALSTRRARLPAVSSLTITLKGSFRRISLTCSSITLWLSSGVWILSSLWVTVRWPGLSLRITGPSANLQISQHSLWCSLSWEHYGKNGQKTLNTSAFLTGSNI